MNEIKYILADFLDEFKRVDLKEKARLIEKFPFPEVTEPKYCAYTAAMVEELCFRNGMPIPDWVFDRQFSLSEPFFVGGLESIKAFLIAESPLPFRRRNIFVSANVLERA